VSIEPAIVNRQRAERVDVRALGAFVGRLVGVFPPRRGDGLAVCLVSDRAMVGLQRAYRGRSTTTDVLSFPGGSRRGPDGRLHVGDIAVCVPQAARQARGGPRAVARELERLVLHGYLHLLGYDHERDDGEMARLERALRRRLVRRRRPTRRSDG
jgi:rRNA maturation RNase YbeY